jgi:hypothetical protein
MVHQFPPVQSPSTLHPPEGMHVKFVLHAPERQTMPPLATVHGPSPTAYPHFRSGSHTPERQTVPWLATAHEPSPFKKPQLLSLASHTPLAQTRLAAATVQVPSSAGPAWGGSFGIGAPFESFAVQV